MWQSLLPGNHVQSGDTLRFINGYAPEHQQVLYNVKRVELHYFEAEPKDKHCLHYAAMRIVRYFDVGYNIMVEVWKD